MFKKNKTLEWLEMKLSINKNFYIKNNMLP